MAKFTQSFLLSFILMGFLISGCITEYSEDVPPLTIPIADEYTPETPQLDSYGIPETRYEITQRTIRRNENLAAIFSQMGFSQDEVNTAMANTRGVLDLRRVVAGRALHLYTDTETGGTPHYIVYEQNLSEFIVFDMLNGGLVSPGQKEVTRRKRSIEGVIEGSLYNTMLASGASPQLVNALSEVFAWQIDFYRIQRGDAFRVIYEENVIDGTPTSVHRIEAAFFRHAGRDYYAIYYDQHGDGSGEYYDLVGESMRKAFLRAPLEYSRISSRFTNRRFHPILRRNMPHHGTDYAAPVGTPIRATGDGVITRAGFDNNNGNYVRIRHNGTYESGYLHMSRIASGIRTGTSVRQGQIIGYVGMTGLATGPHLCYRFWINGQPADPHRIEFPSAEPIVPESMASYKVHRSHMFAALSRPATADRPGAWSLIAVDDITAHVPARPLVLTFLD
jgi:murein DD-endopeptidase MepM/ murein hydrolase activator NlpD